MASNTHRHRAYVVSRTAYAVILLSLLLMLIGAMSCSPAKKAARAEKKAHKKLDKSIMTDPSVFVRRCAFQFDNTDSIHEKIVYKPGETKYDTITEVQLEVLNDTVYLTKVKTVTVTKVDTVDMSRYQREVNAAALDSVKRHYEKKLAEKEQENTDLKVKLAKEQKENSLLWWWGSILSIYTLARWVVRWVTKGAVKLP